MVFRLESTLPFDTILNGSISDYQLDTTIPTRHAEQLRSEEACSSSSELPCHAHCRMVFVCFVASSVVLETKPGKTDATKRVRLYSGWILFLCRYSPYKVVFKLLDLNPTQVLRNTNAIPHVEHRRNRFPLREWIDKAVLITPTSCTCNVLATSCRRSFGLVRQNTASI
jgi:hypothetical protein